MTAGRSNASPREPLLVSERLFYRRLTHEDLPWLIELRTADAVKRYLGGDAMQNPEALEARLNHYIDCHDKFGFGCCAMGLRATGELIGTGGLQPLEDTGEIEIGYNMAERYWDQGYGTECCMAWLRYGFHRSGLERIVAIAHPDNVGSWRIMEKCGMHFEKSSHHYGIECVYYAIEKAEFERLDLDQN